MCTANSCRSQIAETWARHLFPPDWEVASCGLITYPIAEETRAVMAEVGLSMAGQRSKTLDEIDLDAFDVVVTLSEEAGRFLPELRAGVRHIAVPIPDPMVALDDATGARGAFRAGRDRIRSLVEGLVADRIAAEPSDATASREDGRAIGREKSPSEVDASEPDEDHEA